MQHKPQLETVGRTSGVSDQLTTILTDWFCSLAVEVAFVAGLQDILSLKSLLNALHLCRLCCVVIEICHVAKSRSVR